MGVLIQDLWRIKTTESSRPNTLPGPYHSDVSSRLQYTPSLIMYIFPDGFYILIYCLIYFQ